ISYLEIQLLSGVSGGYIILSGQTELAKSTLCLFPNNWDGLSNAPLDFKIRFLDITESEYGSCYEF
ncbi:MAG: hypothetical protein ACLT24_21485, partial [Klebsiella sp.]